MSQVNTYRTVYVCVTYVFSIRLVTSEYPTLIYLKNLLLTSDLIYTGKFQILSATKEIFTQKYIIPRVFVNYTENQLQGKGTMRNQKDHTTMRWEGQQRKNKEERRKINSRLMDSVASITYTSRLSSSTKLCSDFLFNSNFLHVWVSIRRYLEYRQFLELSIFFS